MTSFARRNWRAQSVDETCLLFLKLLRGTMPKTPTTERETATFRLPAALLERARRDGAERGLAYVRSVEEALEVYFFARLPPPMAEALEQDIKDQKVSRENYFYSLLDARYRQILAKEPSKAAQARKK
jgi:hypothetical protein